MTMAFGMGVDIPDIRVIHYRPRGDIKSYFQERGYRCARRNGEPVVRIS